MVSYQGFIWPLLDCATHGPCYISNVASPIEGWWHVRGPPTPQAFQLLDRAGTPPSDIFCEIQTPTALNPV